MSQALIRPILSRITNILKSRPLPSLNNPLPLIKCQPALNYSRQILKPIEVEPVDKKVEESLTKEILKKVNDQLNSPERMFAVVQVCGKQFKITTGDAIIIEGYWPPDVGDKLKLEKVLLAGSSSFSLVGTPLVEPGLVSVNATVIEKNLSHTRTHFRKKRRKQYMRMNFYREPRTMLRINDISVQKLEENLEY